MWVNNLGMELLGVPCSEAPKRNAPIHHYISQPILDDGLHVSFDGPMQNGKAAIGVLVRRYDGSVLGALWLRWQVLFVGGSGGGSGFHSCHLSSKSLQWPPSEFYFRLCFASSTSKTSSEEVFSIVGHFIDLIRKLFCVFSSFSIVFIRCQLNVLAHRLAVLGLSYKGFTEWLDGVPSSVVSAIADIPILYFF